MRWIGQCRSCGQPSHECAHRGRVDQRLQPPNLFGERLRREVVALWDEYEAAESPEARLAKALDKLETILQHTQGQNPPGFDYGFNLGYGREHTAQPPLIAAIRDVLDRATEDRARDASRHGS